MKEQEPEPELVELVEVDIYDFYIEVQQKWDYHATQLNTFSKMVEATERGRDLGFNVKHMLNPKTGFLSVIWRKPHEMGFKDPTPPEVEMDFELTKETVEDLMNLTNNKPEDE